MQKACRIQESTLMSFKGENDLHFTCIHAYPNTFTYKIKPDAGNFRFSKRKSQECYSPVLLIAAQQCHKLSYSRSRTDTGDSITVWNQCFHLNIPRRWPILQCYIFSVVFPVSQGHITRSLEQWPVADSTLEHSSCWVTGIFHFCGNTPPSSKVKQVQCCQCHLCSMLPYCFL